MMLRPIASLRVLAPAGLALLLWGTVVVPGGAGTRSIDTFLLSHFDLTADELRGLASRQSVSRTLAAVDGREVATLGVVQMNVPPAFYVEQLRDIARFKRHEAVLQIGVFNTPARASDLAGLTLEPDDARKLGRCRPGDCGLQLSADAIRRFGREVAWDADEAADQANGLFRQVLAEMVNAYRASGDAALMRYEDSRRPLSPAREFRALIDSPPAILDRFPALRRHVLEFPSPPPGGEDIVYWSKERIGPTVVVSVTHMAIVPIHDDGPAAFAIASRHLYGTHVFDSSLGLTVLVHDPAAPPGTYLVYLNRSRVDALGGFFGGLKRAVVRSRTRAAVAENLIHARDLVEGRFAGRPDP